MESLFGPEDGGEIAYRLSQRIAFFLESDRGSAQKTYALAKDCYKVRSKLVHGFRVARINDGDFVKYLTESETLLRRSLLKVLGTPSTITNMEGKGREEYLDNLVFD